MNAWTDCVLTAIFPVASEHPVRGQNPRVWHELAVRQLHLLTPSIQSQHPLSLLNHDPSHLVQIDAPALLAVALLERFQGSQDEAHLHRRSILLGIEADGAITGDVASAGAADDVLVVVYEGVSVVAIDRLGQLRDEVVDGVQGARSLGAAWLAVAVMGAFTIQGPRVGQDGDCFLGS